MRRMCKLLVLWQVEQLHLRIRVVERSVVERNGGGRVMYAMYLVFPQWQEPL